MFIKCLCDGYFNVCLVIISLHLVWWWGVLAWVFFHHPRCSNYLTTTWVVYNKAAISLIYMDGGGLCNCYCWTHNYFPLYWNLAPSIKSNYPLPPLYPNRFSWFCGGPSVCFGWNPTFLYIKVKLCIFPSNCSLPQIPG